jgi:hypothetical protein
MVEHVPVLLGHGHSCMSYNKLFFKISFKASNFLVLGFKHWTSCLLDEHCTT